jgi:flagellar motility protein MotE (MotC chaperone)
MIRKLHGKLLFGGLVLTAFAKAAISFPILPTPADTSFPPDSIVLAGTESDEGEEAIFDKEAPPSVIIGLGDGPATCLVPEEVLQSLSDERALVEDQKRAISAHASEVNLAREKLNIEKSALLELKGSIEGLLKRVEAQQTDDLLRLSAVYQNMKPTDAALIMNEMDIEVMIMVLGTMKPRVAAPIMAKMSPVRARAVSKIILERSKLPGDQDLNGVRLN